MTQLEKLYFAKRDVRVLSILQESTVGIAGAGGLGSNAAMLLARAGIGRLIIADFDVVEPSDLNRQFYFLDQVGLPKVVALEQNLKKINPYSTYEMHQVKISPDNLKEIFSPADLLIEAFDEADQKQMLIEQWLAHFPDRPIIAASGLAGFGANNKIRQRKLGNLYICGDQESECNESTLPMAPRVTIVAAMQANLAIELLVKIKGKKKKN